MNQDRFKITGWKKVLWLIVFWAAAWLSAPIVSAADQPAFLHLPEECGWWNRCPIPAPTILTPSVGTDLPVGSMVVQGLTWNNTQVDIFLDSKLIGRPVVKNNSQAEVTSFNFKFDHLVPGVHKLYAVAYSLNGWERSPDSRHLDFLAVAPYPTPVFIQPLRTASDQILLRGFVRRQSVLEISLDKESLPLVVIDDASNRSTAHFVINLPSLGVGSHELSVTALDAVTGKPSRPAWLELKVTAQAVELVGSAVVNQPIRSTRQPVIKGVSAFGQLVEPGVVTDWQPLASNTRPADSLSARQQVRWVGLVLLLACLLSWWLLARYQGQPIKSLLT